MTKTASRHDTSLLRGRAEVLVRDLAFSARINLSEKDFDAAVERVMKDLVAVSKWERRS